MTDQHQCRQEPQRKPIDYISDIPSFVSFSTDLVAPVYAQKSTRWVVEESRMQSIVFIWIFDVLDFLEAFCEIGNVLHLPRPSGNLLRPHDDDGREYQDSLMNGIADANPRHSFGFSLSFGLANWQITGRAGREIDLSSGISAYILMYNGWESYIR